MKIKEKVKQFGVLILFLSAVHYVACIVFSFAYVIAMPGFDNPVPNASASPYIPFIKTVRDVLGFPLNVLGDIPLIGNVANSGFSFVLHVLDFINSALWGVSLILLLIAVKSFNKWRKK